MEILLTVCVSVSSALSGWFIGTVGAKADIHLSILMVLGLSVALTLVKVWL